MVPRRIAHGRIVRYEVTSHENWRTDLYIMKCVMCLVTGKDYSIEASFQGTASVIREVLLDNDA
jgi:hypothetical protein